MSTRGIMSIVGAILLVGGIIGFTYQYNYTTTEKVAEIGPLKVSAEKEKTISVPPILNGIAVGAGLVLLLASVFRR